MMPATRVLVFGGTFDPPHLAHTTLPPLVAGRLGCHRIIYIPAAANPLKTDQPVTEAHHRLAMLEFAVADVPGAEISTIELERPGPSYTIETLEALGRLLEEGTDLFMLIGSDQALSFHKWKDWQRILELATPAVMVRPPLDRDIFRQRLAERYDAAETARWLDHSVAVPQLDICASGLRERLESDGDVRGLLQPTVLAYIRKHGLYG
jgi:nicotinate-nucleotide adenylyltransferase